MTFQPSEYSGPAVSISVPGFETRQQKPCATCYLAIGSFGAAMGAFLAHTAWGSEQVVKGAGIGATMGLALLFATSLPQKQTLTLDFNKI